MPKTNTHFLKKAYTHFLKLTNTHFLKKGFFTMAYTLEQIEWLHDNGKMPDWAYYQQNGKSAQANFEE